MTMSKDKIIGSLKSIQEVFIKGTGDADIVILNKKLKIELTMVNGKVVYRREEV